jgi:hypothetical protein
VALFGCELGVQALGLAFFLAPNALVAAQPCSWFLTPVYVCSCLRWSCWNTVGVGGGGGGDWVLKKRL